MIPILERPIEFCENKEELLDLIEDVYSRIQAVVISLNGKEMAFAQFWAAHEDDLPSA
ncbi:MAG: hypothetical protein IIC56_04315 [Proteobacteria bacterium]|nr:hypothetical protein [Pseudomonadota bacterium]